MKKFVRLTALLLAVAMTLALTACGGSDAGSSGTLTMQIWDTAQRDGMQALADAYHEKNPDITVEIQVTSWDEYWTKLEAAATSNTLPDVFWMHTNYILQYADNGMLADLTDLYSGESATYYTDHFSDVSLSNASGSDGKIYGVPKDKDTVGLVYNKEMFDAAGVAYPDETWTWDDLVNASATIYEKTGKYGYMAYADDQLGYWNFVYQNGGYILNEDKTAAGFDQPATIEAMKFYIGLQSNDWCPTQTYFAETAPGNAFFSQQGAMFLEGNWNLMSEMKNYPDMQGKWDVAVLPACPDPESGDGRATISNGLCYATSAKNQDNEVVLDFLRFLGSEEGQRIQGESGAAIPAYNGLEDTWCSAFDQFDYKLNVGVFIDMFDYSVQSVNDKSRPNWKSKVSDELLKIYGGTVDVDTGLANINTIINDAIAEAAG
ncbi:ABC transporter substrate-binding protein [Angelakisella massiliensis]|uniref:ABC transporter substrate-binding protein n=1 Tax=Angelakisella massiliensis TaxID=1871018 RepID=UPI0008F86C00|nr:sugar ABC transporter substrate-binding protein [Angelakisella massiliensis]